MIKLYKISDSENADVMIEHIASSPLKQSMLDSQYCFILDIGAELFVWIGKGCSNQVKEMSLKYATNFLQENNRPSWTTITRIVEGF